jgi:superfamily II DNA or RNA helicase
MTNLTEELIFLVYNNPGLKGREYTYLVNDRNNTYFEKKEINHILYSRRDIFIPNHDERMVPKWTLTDLGLKYAKKESRGEKIDVKHTNGHTYSDITGLKPYPWQINAIHAWADAGYRGVIEAVTGSGKTYSAMMALEEHIRQGWRVAILVPSIVLQNQWIQKIRKLNSKNEYKIGFMNGTKTDTLDENDILIASVQCAYRWQMNSHVKKALLIADECHHLGAESWSKALEDAFCRRLGLTATFERNDTGIEDFLIPYFGGVVYTLDYVQALHENVISPFSVKFISVELNDVERNIYDSADDSCKKLRKKLINEYQLDAEPFGTFIKEVNQIVSEGESPPFLASRYLSSFTKRRNILADLTAKTKKLIEICCDVENAKRTIVFTQTIAGAQSAIQTFHRCGIQCDYLTSEMKKADREAVIERFRIGDIKLIAAPQLMDEGVDIPTADLAIIIAASRTKRQMIQRMGRVLRKDNDDKKKKAKVCVLFAKNTFEDPVTGAHETFIEMLLDATDDVQIQ